MMLPSRREPELNWSAWGIERPLHIVIASLALSWAAAYYQDWHLFPKRRSYLRLKENGRSGGARTHYLKVRNLALYPVELHFQRLSSNRICGLTLANRQGLPEDWKYFALVVMSSCQRTWLNGGVAGNRTPVRNVAPAQSFTRLAATCRLALRNGLPQPSLQCIGDFETVSCTNREHSPMLPGKTSVDYPARTTLIPHLCE